MTRHFLGIGLDRVDPGHYDGWDGALNACVKDAQAMKRLCGGPGELMRLNEAATAEFVLDCLGALASRAVPGDRVVISYSGHGGEIPDLDGDEESGMDQTWVLFDRQLLDDELHAALARFAPGVRVVLVSDSCHSGTVVRAALRPKTLPKSVAASVYASHRGLYDAARVLEAPGVQASVISLTACRDDQLAMDGEENGAFTGALLATYGSGFGGTYQQFLNEIRAKLPPSQIPQIQFIGAWSAAFSQSNPFAA